MTRVPPHDLDAERDLIGACLIRPDLIGVCAEIVAVEDFYRPQNAIIWEAITADWHSGGRPDVRTVAAALPASVDRSELVTAQSGVASSTNAPRYAQVVAERAVLRRLIGVAGEVAEAGYRQGADAADVLELAQGLVGGVELPSVQVDASQSVEDLVDTADEGFDWVIPGLLDRSDRVLIVAQVGVGKTMVMRQMAVAAGQGIHPFALSHIPPIRTLLVDLENPRRIIRQTLTRMVDRARAESRCHDRERARIWRRQEGVNIRTPAGFSTLDRLFAEAQPDLVCMGPLYKLFSAGKGERSYDEQVAADVTGRLDDLRTRHGFALVLEHHAPHGERRPFGSQLWERWPEFGPLLTPTKPGRRDELEWAEWRPPRDLRPWPDRLQYGTGWPWVGWWENGLEEAS